MVFNACSRVSSRVSMDQMTADLVTIPGFSSFSEYSVVGIIRSTAF